MNLFDNFICYDNSCKILYVNVYCLVFSGQYDQMLSPMRWDLITKKLVIMAVTGLVFFIITILCEYRFFIKAR